MYNCCRVKTTSDCLLLTVPLGVALRWSVVAAATATTVCHGYDVGSTIERLVEVADVTRDVLVSGDGEGNDGLPSQVSTLKNPEEREDGNVPRSKK
jgi:hypothetical protein